MSTESTGVTVSSVVDQLMSEILPIVEKRQRKFVARLMKEISGKIKISLDKMADGNQRFL